VSSGAFALFITSLAFETPLAQERRGSRYGRPPEIRFMRGGTHSPQEALEHWREVDSLSASYLIRANRLLTYAQKPRTETEEKACSGERAKETIG
jgi:hypothetical protein